MLTGSTGSIEPVYPKVLLVNYDPVFHSKGGRRLSSLFGWGDVDQLTTDFIDDLREASYGYCNYQIVERLDVDAFPIKIDGFSYTAESYASAWQARHGFHQPDWADYDRILADFDVIHRIENGQIDELWLFAPPYGGFYESRMAGPGAFWCNSPPLDNYGRISRKFVIMGFNYERGVGEMLESYGHRAESIMAQVYKSKRGVANLWERFISYDQVRPGQAEVGNVHFAPNSQRDYDWGNRAKVLSRCDTWLNFPDLSGRPRQLNCTEWGNGDTRQHHLWWFKHFPHVAGQTGGLENNWWQYVVDPNRTPG
jgi:hypothetical protein